MFATVIHFPRFNQAVALRGSSAILARQTSMANPLSSHEPIICIPSNSSSLVPWSRESTKSTNSSVLSSLPTRRISHLSGHRVANSLHRSSARRWSSTAASISGNSASQSSKSWRKSFHHWELYTHVLHSSIVDVSEDGLSDRLLIIASTSSVKSLLFFSSKQFIVIVRSNFSLDSQSIISSTVCPRLQ